MKDRAGLHVAGAVSVEFGMQLVCGGCKLALLSRNERFDGLDF